MKYRKLDENGDYTFGRRNEMLEGTEAVAQAVKTRLLLLYGEWWENRLDGTPLFEKVFGKRLRTDETPDEIDLIFSERISETQGVSEITKFESRIESESRAYTADITIKAIYETEFSVSVSSGANPLEINM